jgi:hypothetical protein
MNLKEAHQQKAKHFEQIEALEKQEAAFAAQPDAIKLAILLHDYLCEKPQHHYCGLNYRNPQNINQQAQSKKYLERARLILQETGVKYETIAWMFQVGMGYEALAPKEAKARTQKRATNPLAQTQARTVRSNY